MIRISIDEAPLGLATLRDAWRGPVSVTLEDPVREGVEVSRQRVAAVLASGKRVYGVNTGFGLLANVRVDNKELARLQENLIRSHAVGVGSRLPDATVRLIMLMKIKALSQGYSGVRAELIDALCALLNAGIYPEIPSKGSVGASGDLAPLAHMACALIGEGYVYVGRERKPATDALRDAGLEPLKLAPKEGLALLNGTQVSTAIALTAVFRMENLMAAALTAGAMSADAIKGSDTPFDARIQEVRGHAGQRDVATMLRTLLEGSDIRVSHLECDRVQDPYCIRCQPQVMGACLDVLRHVAGVLTVEANAVTDNPLVFEDAVLSGGNFHAEPVAFAADYLALAISEVGSLSERRTALLVDPNLSGLPAFLVKESGLNSGFMMVQIVAAALASENKQLAHPASVDSIPTSANQEDHVSMATSAANRLHRIIDNVNDIVAIELLSAAQGIDFHHPCKSSGLLEEAYSTVRAVSPHFDADRSLKQDVDLVSALIDEGRFHASCSSIMPSASA